MKALKMAAVFGGCDRKYLSGPSNTALQKENSWETVNDCNLILLQSSAAHYSVVLGRPVSLETVLACRRRRRILTPYIRKPQPATITDEI